MAFGCGLGLGLGDGSAGPVLRVHAPGWVQTAGFVLPVTVLASAMTEITAAAATVTGASNP